MITATEVNLPVFYYSLMTDVIKVIAGALNYSRRRGDSLLSDVAVETNSTVVLSS